MEPRTLIVFGEKVWLEDMRWICRVSEIAEILNMSRAILPITSVEEGEEAEIQRVKMLFGATDG